MLKTTKVKIFIVFDNENLHNLLPKTTDVGHCLKNLRKKIEEAAKIHKELGTLGEKITKFIRRTIKTVSHERCEEKEKAEMLAAITRNIYFHYTNHHDRIFESGVKKGEKICRHQGLPSRIVSNKVAQKVLWNILSGFASDYCPHLTKNLNSNANESLNSNIHRMVLFLFLFLLESDRQPTIISVSQSQFRESILSSEGRCCNFRKSGC